MIGTINNDTTVEKHITTKPVEPAKPQEKEIKVVIGAHEWEQNNKNYKYDNYSTNAFDIVKQYRLSDENPYNYFDSKRTLNTRDTLIFQGFEKADIAKYENAMDVYYKDLEQYEAAVEKEKAATELRMENETAKAGIQRASINGLDKKYTLKHNEETGEVTIIVNEDTNLGTIREELGLEEGALRAYNKDQIEKMEEKGFLSNFRTTCDDRVATAGTELKIPGSKFKL